MVVGGAIVPPIGVGAVVAVEFGKDGSGPWNKVRWNYKVTVHSSPRLFIDVLKSACSVTGAASKVREVGVPTVAVTIRAFSGIRVYKLLSLQNVA